MKLTKSNITEKWPEAKTLLADQKEFIELAEDSFIPFVSLYDDFDEDMKKDFNLFLEKANALLEAKEKPKEPYETPTITDNRDPYVKPTMTVKDKPKPKGAKKPTKKPTDDVKIVDVVPLECSLFNSFANLFNPKSRSTKSVKVRAVELLKKMQKAIVEKKVRKTSQYADELRMMQDALVSFCNGKKKLDETVSEDFVERLKKIGKSTKVSVNKKLVKKFIDLQFAPTKAGAQDLLSAINEAIEADLANEELKAVVKPLKDYNEGKTTKVEISSRELRGLKGLQGVNYEENEPDGTITVNEFREMKYDLLGFSGKWLDFFGNPDRIFRFMIYGKGGQGKSTLALKLADYLANELRLRVCYLSAEEGFKYTFREKFDRLGIDGSNIRIADDLAAINRSLYDVIFVDSVTELGISPQELKEIFPKDRGYVFLFHCKKDGDYKGNSSFSHDVDAVFEVDNMRVISHKNRFAPAGKEMMIL